MAPTSVREAIEKLSKLFVAQPERARAKNSPATATLTEGLKFQVTGAHGESASTDMPRAVGGEGSAPNPAWLLRASLASCTATVIAMRAAQLGVALSTLEVSVSSESDARGMLGTDDGVSAGLLDLWTDVKIDAADTTGEQLEEIVRWADAHSPVGCTLRRPSASGLRIEVA